MTGHDRPRWGGMTVDVLVRSAGTSRPSTCHPRPLSRRTRTENHAHVAQLDRASASGADGWGFESLHGCRPSIFGLWRRLVSASVWGTEGRGFESRQPDQVAVSTADREHTPGSSAAWLARLLWEQEAAGSNPASPTMIRVTVDLAAAGNGSSQRLADIEISNISGDTRRVATYRVVRRGQRSDIVEVVTVSHDRRRGWAALVSEAVAALTVNPGLDEDG